MVKVEINTLQRAKDGNSINGDAYSITETSQGLLITVADGLGSGPQASAASQKALRLIEENKSLTLKDMIILLHDGLKTTRGAALAIFKINFMNTWADYVSVGNVQGIAICDKVRIFVSTPGILGYNLPEPVFLNTFNLNELDFLILFTDGLHITDTSTLKFDANLSSEQVISILLSTYKVMLDDLTILVVKFVRE